MRLNCPFERIITDIIIIMTGIFYMNEEFELRHASEFRANNRTARLHYLNQSFINVIIHMLLLLLQPTGQLTRPLSS